MPIKRDLNTSKVVDAALVLIRESGFQSLSLHKVAKRLNVKTPSLYNHINSYEDLVQELSLYGLQMLQKKWTEGLIGVDQEQALEVIIDTYIDFIGDEPELYYLIDTPPIVMTEKWIRASNELADIVINVVSFHSHSRIECIHKVRLLRSFLSGFANITFAGGFKMDVPISETYQFAKEHLLNMLKS